MRTSSCTRSQHRFHSTNGPAPGSTGSSTTACHSGSPGRACLAFVRLTSNQRLFDRPVSVATAWRQVEEWLACESAWVPQPTPRHQGILGELLIATGVRAEHVPDAHLAALALEHGLAVVSADTDFSRFPGLRLENPVA